MGLLSKLFGKTAEEMANELIESAKRSAESSTKRTDPNEVVKNLRFVDAQKKSASSLSYGDDMPAEENQYNSGKSWLEYFSGIFSAEFAEYDVVCDKKASGTRDVFTFKDGGRTALVVELLSEQSESNAVRTECSRSRTPYLRFYYDHDGWWNTRSYVVGRVRAALNG